MADFAVAHLAFGQSYCETRRFQQCLWVPTDESVPSRGRRQCDRVSFTFLAISPAVEHHQDNRTFRHVVENGRSGGINDISDMSGIGEPEQRREIYTACAGKRPSSNG
jgi:hypothetical protein